MENITNITHVSNLWLYVKTLLRLHLCVYNILRENLTLWMQAFIKTAGKIYQKIEEGIFDVSNEVACLVVHGGINLFCKYGCIISFGIYNSILICFPYMLLLYCFSHILQSLSLVQFACAILVCLVSKKEWVSFAQSHGIKVGYGGGTRTGPTGRDAQGGQSGGCCS